MSALHCYRTIYRFMAKNYKQVEDTIVLSIMKHAFTTIPGVLWIVTAVVLFFYRLNKKRYNEIVEELKNGRKS